MNKDLIFLSSALLAAGGAFAGQSEQVEVYVPAGDRAMFVSKMTVDEPKASADQPTADDAKNKAATSTARRLSGSIVEINQVSAEDSTKDTVNLVVAVTLDRRYTMPLSVADKDQGFELGKPVSVTGKLDVDGDHVYFTPKTLYSQGKDRALINQEAVKLSPAAAEAEDGPDQARIAGQVDWYQKVSIQGLDEEAEVIRVHMADGTSDLIHLGNGPREFKLDLDKGEEIEVIGVNKLINGKEILFADQFFVDGVQKL